MARRHICDVPGCERERKRWQRLCEPCFKALPGDIRSDILDCWKCGDKPRHRAACKRAGEFMDRRIERTPVTPQRFQEMQERLLGER